MSIFAPTTTILADLKAPVSLVIADEMLVAIVAT